MYAGLCNIGLVTVHRIDVTKNGEAICRLERNLGSLGVSIPR
jgi:hypothetical protein